MFTQHKWLWISFFLSEGALGEAGLTLSNNKDVDHNMGYERVRIVSKTITIQYFKKY